jgi:hypothetical protein
MQECRAAAMGLVLLSFGAGISHHRNRTDFWKRGFRNT